MTPPIETSSAVQKRPAVPAREKWLSIIGISEDGVEGLSATARRRIADAAVVYGGNRHLDLVGELVTGEAQAWPRPIRDAIPDLLARRGQAVAVLVSGDPFFHSMGSIIAEEVSAEEFDAFPAPSSISLAAARMGWAIQDSEIVSLCGRPVEELIPYLQPGRRLLVLSSDETTPGAVAALLTERGFGASALTVLERLGGAAEKVGTCRADAFATDVVARLNMMAITVQASTEARPIPRASGLDDAVFDNDGMLTKREVRAITLSSLAPHPGEMLWDIGTGSGAVAIEWLLAHPANRAIAVEHHEERAAVARANAKKLGVPHLEIIVGRAPVALEGLEAPNAVFIGGGLSSTGVFDTAWEHLLPGGRLVANSVTLESDGVLAKAMKPTGGSMTRISVERLDQIGRMHGYRPAMTVTQFRALKPWR